MLKRELKINFKSFIIWSSVLLGILLLAFLVYPAMSSQTEQLDELLKTFPEEILKAFSMDLISIGSISGWFATEGYMMVTLIGGSYVALMGGSILLKEESDKTIEYLYSKPISRNKIILDKILTGVIYIFILNLIISIFTLVSFYLSDDLNVNLWFVMSVAPLFLHYLFFFISLFISTFFKKVKAMTGISLGLVLGTYFIHIITLMSDKVEFLKYITPHEYFSSRYLIINERLHYGYLVLTIILITLSIFMTYYRYNKKELTA
jgi:ABC-2 type transport system permease protein